MIYGCIKFIGSYRFLLRSLDKLFERLDNDEFVIFEKKILIIDNNLIKNYLTHMNFSKILMNTVNQVTI